MFTPSLTLHRKHSVSRSFFTGTPYGPPVNAHRCIRQQLLPSLRDLSPDFWREPQIRGSVGSSVLLRSATAHESARHAVRRNLGGWLVRVTNLPLWAGVSTWLWKVLHTAWTRAVEENLVELWQEHLSIKPQTWFEDQIGQKSPVVERQHKTTSCVVWTAQQSDDS